MAEFWVEEAGSSSLVEHEWAETVVRVCGRWGGRCWEIKGGGRSGEWKSVVRKGTGHDLYKQ